MQWPAADADVHLPALLASAFGVSTSEARRSARPGRGQIDGEPVAAGTLDLPAAELDGPVGRRRSHASGSSGPLPARVPSGAAPRGAGGPSA